MAFVIELLNTLKLWHFQLITGLFSSSTITFAESNDTSRSLSSVIQQSDDVQSDIYSHDLIPAAVALGTSSDIIYSTNIAKSMCCIMSLAYENLQTLKMCVPDSADILLNTNTVNMIQFKEQTLVVIAFSGTKKESLRDWWVNITGNYKKEWEGVKPRVISALSKLSTPHNIVFCGHSKGGVEAIISFNDLLTENVDNLTNCKFVSCYVAGVPDYFIKYSQLLTLPGIFNIKHRQDPVANVLGSSTSNWEILVGENGTYNIETHKILTYFNHF